MSVIEQLNLCFDAHFNLVSIHPFYDKNEKTSRLLMNYYKLIITYLWPLCKAKNKAEYIQALVDTRQKEDIQLFRNSMWNEYSYLLQQEIEKFKRPSKGSAFSLVL